MLYIIYKRYSLSNFLLEELSQNKNYYLLCVENIKMNFFKRIICYIDRNISINIDSSECFFLSVLNQLRSIKENDRILLFDIDSLADIKYLKKNIKSKHINLWLWNKLCFINNKYYIDTIKKLNIQIYTFDFMDSKKYNLILLNQVYRFLPKNMTSSIKYDFFFIGQDKGRAKSLEKLASELSKAGYKVKFMIKIQKKKNLYYTKYRFLDFFTNYIPYEEIIKLVSSSKVIVDFAKDKQTGITIRTLEGVFLGKKIMTNNIYIKKYSIYNDNNIFIIQDCYKIQEIMHFMQKDYEEYGNIINEYSIKSWINNFS